MTGARSGYRAQQLTPMRIEAENYFEAGVRLQQAAMPASGHGRLGSFRNFQCRAVWSHSATNLFVY